MDPNANLKAQDELYRQGRNARRGAEMNELRDALNRWLRRGGFDPDWSAFPKASKSFFRWTGSAICCRMEVANV